MIFLFKDLFYYFKKVFAYLKFNASGVRTQLTCSIHLRAKIEKGSSFFGHTKITGDVTIGRYTYATDAIIQNATVGSFGSIAPGVKIGLNEHPLDRILLHPFGYDRDYYDRNLPKTKIGNDVWIGANSVILVGITVGDGAVIAAGAIVTKDVAPFSIVGGVPAKPIGARKKHETFDQIVAQKDIATIKSLVKSHSNSITLNETNNPIL